MKRLLSIGVVSLFIGMTAMTPSGGQDRGGNEGIRERFVGAWRLVSLEAPGPDGKIHRADSTGMLSSRATATRRFRSWSATRRHRLRRDLSSTRKAAMKPLLVCTKSMRALTPSPSMLKAHWCGR